jgi:dTDP-4-dehydrorhamnose reductase
MMQISMANLTKQWLIIYHIVVKRVLIMGSTGMLGSAMKSVFLSSDNEIYCTSRNPNQMENSPDVYFDFSRHDLAGWFNEKPKFDYVINCIGAIPQKYTIKSQSEIRDMIIVNSFLPADLESLSTKGLFDVIQIATDCVFSGLSGNYDEGALHDAIDLYGVSKSLGELRSPNSMHLRCSVIGDADSSNSSLHNWFLSNKSDSNVQGFTNHKWNGITTLAFAKIVLGIVNFGGFKPGLQHIVPLDIVSKYDLLRIIADVKERHDIRINPVENSTRVDRTLRSKYSERNETLWRHAGYAKLPTIRELVQELDWESKGVKINED